MHIMKSRPVIQLIKNGWLAPTILLTGCSLPPSIPVLGAYYPGWLFCIIAGVILTLVTRRVIRHKCKTLPFAGVMYTALFALYAMLFWLIFF